MPGPPPAAAGPPPFDCARCGRRVKGENPDEAGWCGRCRRALIRSSARRAWLPAVAVALAYGWLLLWSGLLESPALIFFLALGAILAFLAYKVARRVFFDLLRGRPTGDVTDEA